MPTVQIPIYLNYKKFAKYLKNKDKINDKVKTLVKNEVGEKC